MSGAAGIASYASASMTCAPRSRSSSARLFRAIRVLVVRRWNQANRWEWNCAASSLPHRSSDFVGEVFRRCDEERLAAKREVVHLRRLGDQVGRSLLNEFCPHGVNDFLPMRRVASILGSDDAATLRVRKHRAKTHAALNRGERSEGDVASAANAGAEGPLRLGRAAGTRVVNRGQQVENRTVALSSLQGERALTGGGGHLSDPPSAESPR